jgi:tetratricopeptide (TPR) repeat protein/DNA-binding CsgD family transcriptional regulator
MTFNLSQSVKRTKARFASTLLLATILTAVFAIIAPNAKSDSLFNIHSDTTIVRTLIDEAKSIENTNPAKAIGIYRRALKAATQVEYSRINSIINNLGWLYLSTGGHDSSAYFFKRVIVATTESGDEELLINSYRGLGQTFLRKSAFDSAHYFLDRALKDAIQFSSFRQQAEIHNDLGNTFIEENNFLKAIDEYIQAAKFYDSVLHNANGYATALFNIGNIHSVMGNTDEALRYVKSGRELAKKNNYLKGIAYGYKLIGRIYRKQGKSDSAIFSYNEALENYLKFGDKHNAAELELSLGNIYYDRKEYRVALRHLDKATQYARPIQGKTELAYIYSSQGFNYYALNDFNRATIYFDSSRLVANEIHNAYLVMDAYQILGQIEKEKGDYKRALDFQEKFSFLNDSLSKAENRKAVAEIQTKYETVAKQAQIELLQKDQRINRISNYTLAAFIFFGLILAALLFNRSQIRVKTASRLAEKEVELSRQQKELFEVELKARRLQQEQLRLELDFKNRELTTYTLNLIQKNEVLEELRTALEQLDRSNGQNNMTGILQKLKYSSHLDKEWDGFKRYFEQVHTGFFDSLLKQYPELSASELKLCALLKLNLETKEMASLLGISPESVKVARSRLRKKLSLEAEQNLTIFLTALK